MRVLILRDNKITNKQVTDLKAEFSSIVHEDVNISPEYYETIVDYSDVPTVADSDGDLKPSESYVKALLKDVHTKYGTYGVDSVVMLVHRDNWVFTGIWGTNWSNKYYQYHVHLCRFDHKNKANSLGTLYHEWMHSLDALIKTHTGIEIDTIFSNSTCFVDWDSTSVHGNRFRGCKETPYIYIRYKDNREALRLIAPHLRNAYRVRKDMYLEPFKKVQLKIISWLRSLVNKKSGVPRGT